MSKTKFANTVRSTRKWEAFKGLTRHLKNKHDHLWKLRFLDVITDTRSGLFSPDAPRIMTGSTASSMMACSAPSSTSDECWSTCELETSNVPSLFPAKRRKPDSEFIRFLLNSSRLGSLVFSKCDKLISWAKVIPCTCPSVCVRNSSLKSSNVFVSNGIWKKSKKRYNYIVHIY